MGREGREKRKGEQSQGTVGKATSALNIHSATKSIQGRDGGQSLWSRCATSPAAVAELAWIPSGARASSPWSLTEGNAHLCAGNLPVLQGPNPRPGAAAEPGIQVLHRRLMHPLPEVNPGTQTEKGFPLGILP